MSERGEVLIVTLMVIMLAGLAGFVWGDEARRREVNDCLTVATAALQWERTPEHWDRLTDWCTQP
jgi:hypothetical protein